MDRILTAEQIVAKLARLETKVSAGNLTVGQALLAAFNAGEDHGLRQEGDPRRARPQTPASRQQP